MAKKNKNKITISNEERLELKVKAIKKYNRETQPIPVNMAHDDKREKRIKTRKQAEDKAIKESKGE
jgi:hypothetical protein